MDDSNLKMTILRGFIAYARQQKMHSNRQDELIFAFEIGLNKAIPEARRYPPGVISFLNATVMVDYFDKLQDEWCKCYARLLEHEPILPGRRTERLEAFRAGVLAGFRGVFEERGAHIVVP